MDLTVLSFGGGQDSTYILYKIIRDPEYRRKVVKGRLLVVMCDTGSEHDYTYEHVIFIKQLCIEHGIEFYFLTPDMGYHPNTWPTLEYQMAKNNSIMSMMFPRSCTDNLKIKPFYNFLNVWIARNIYDQTVDQAPAKTRNKKWIYKFHADYGKINVIIGIAAGEEKRIKKSKKEKLKTQLNFFKKPQKQKSDGGKWMRVCINKYYPMVEEGTDREGAQNYILVTPWPLPFPSNCIICPYLSKQEILWLWRFHPDKFEKWVVYEYNKTMRHPPPKKGPNLGVKGEKLLREILAEAVAEFGHWTDEQLNEYKMSHGHCVKSVY
jgi:hypothetical protein